MGGGAGVASGAEGKEANGGGAAACRRRKEGMTNGEREREKRITDFARDGRRRVWKT